jgi:hypothetical protein
MMDKKNFVFNDIFSRNRKLKYSEYLRNKTMYDSSFSVKRIVRQKDTNYIQEVWLLPNTQKANSPKRFVVVKLQGEKILKWNGESYLDKELEEKDGSSIKIRKEYNTLFNKRSLIGGAFLVVINVLLMLYFNDVIDLILISIIVMLLAFMIFSHVSLSTLGEVDKKEIARNKDLIKFNKESVINKQIENKRLSKNLNSLEKKNDRLKNIYLKKAQTELSISRELVKKLTKEKSKTTSKHRKEIENMKEDINQNMKEIKEKFIEKMSEEMQDFVKETKDNIEKKILGNVFSSTSESFNESERLSREEHYRKQNEREAEFQREKDKLEMDRKFQDHVERIFNMTTNINERVFNTEKKVVDFGEQFNRKLTALESMIVQGLATLDSKIESSISKVQVSISEMKTWASENFSTLKMWFKEEVLSIKENQMRLVNKFEEFDIRYKGDMREIQLKFNEFDIRYKADMQGIQNQFKETYLYIDTKAFATHERVLALDYAIKNEGLRLDRKIDSGFLGLQQADMQNERLLQDIQHNLEKGLLYAEAARKENQYKLEKSFYENQAQNEQKFSSLDNESRRREDKGRFDTLRMFDDLNYRTSRNYDELNNKADRNYESLNYKTDYHINDLNHKTEIKYRDLKYATESSISDLKYDNEQKLYILDTKLDKRLDEFASKHNISIKDLHHLIKLKDYEHADFVNKHVSQIRADITNMKAEQKVQYANLDAKYKVELNDLKTLHMKHLYEQDQKIMKVISKIESFQNDISGLSVRMESLKVNIQKMGVENTKVKQEAQHLLNSVQMRMDSINNSLKLARDTSRLIEERIDTKVRGDLLKLKEITLDQESNLKQIAFAEQGMRLIYDEYNNQANQKELEVKRLHDNIETMNKRIADERRAIQTEARLAKREEVMSNKLMELQYDRDSWKKEANDTLQEANMYRKAAAHYQKKSKHY